MTSLSAEILRIAKQAQNRGGVASSIYLTQQHTDQLLAEANMPRCKNMTMLGSFNRVPIYLDRDVSMVICHDGQGEAYLTFI